MSVGPKSRKRRIGVDIDKTESKMFSNSLLICTAPCDGLKEDTVFVCSCETMGFCKDYHSGFTALHLFCEEKGALSSCKRNERYV